MRKRTTRRKAAWRGSAPSMEGWRRWVWSLHGPLRSSGTPTFPLKSKNNPGSRSAGAPGEWRLGRLAQRGLDALGREGDLADAHARGVEDGISQGRRRERDGGLA